MTDGLNYILQRIEYDYLHENSSALLSKNVVCLKDEGLPCNCITGIVVNYSAFLTYACLNENAYTATLDKSEIDALKEEICYIQCRKGDNIVCPIENPTDTTKPYVVGERLCRNSRELEAYISFHSYRELENIEKELREYKENRALGLEKTLYLEFWIRLLGAMRTQPLKDTSRAFLFMAIYLFPNLTLKLILDAKGRFEPEIINNLINDYLEFLSNIGDDKKIGFQRRFVQAFKKSTNIDISVFVESLSPHSDTEKDLFLETLMAAYTRNMEEKKKKKWPFKTDSLK